jgi:lysylphosphatidylglycerol synthetase-like protein (DUF2156 family)
MCEAPWSPQANKRHRCQPSMRTIFIAHFCQSLLQCIAVAILALYSSVWLALFAAWTLDTGRTAVEDRKILWYVCVVVALGVALVVLLLSASLVGVYIGAVWLWGQQAAVQRQARLHNAGTNSATEICWIWFSFCT